MTPLKELYLFKLFTSFQLAQVLQSTASPLWNLTALRSLICTRPDVRFVKSIKFFSWTGVPFYWFLGKKCNIFNSFNHQCHPRSWKDIFYPYLDTFLFPFHVHCAWLLFILTFPRKSLDILDFFSFPSRISQISCQENQKFTWLSWQHELVFLRCWLGNQFNNFRE